MKNTILFRHFVSLLIVGFCCLSSVPVLAQNGLLTDHVKLISGGVNLGAWNNEISELPQAPAPTTYESPSMLVLAAQRTNRPDLLRHFKHYHGGWNITNRHYWASVGFTGAVGFIFAALWFVSFGLVLLAYHCYKWRVNIKGKRTDHSQTICLILLIFVITRTYITLMSTMLWSFYYLIYFGSDFIVGQDEFHGEVLHTLKYVVNQSDYTVQILNNVTQYLSLAKTINVAELFLPSNVMTDIDKLNIDLNAAADTLTEKTDENAVKIRRVFNAAIGIDLRGSSDANFGPAFAFVVCSKAPTCHSHIHSERLVTSRYYFHPLWSFCTPERKMNRQLFAFANSMLHAETISQIAISDTCLAMEEWVENPNAETALSNILPCVDQRTTNHTLTQSKQVINSLVKVVNTYIYTFSNSNPSPADNRYHNQSGPSMPLCSPFDSQLLDRQCGSNKVSMANASLAWQNFTCMVSASGLCTTTGRITPDRFMQLVAAVNESFALEHYTPLLLCLQNCDFVRDTCQKIGSNYCHPLEHYLKIVNAGLGLISVGVLLCLVLWIFYADCPFRADAIVKLLFPIKCMNCRKICSPKSDKTTNCPWQFQEVMVLMYDINDRTRGLSQEVDTQRKIYGNASYTREPIRLRPKSQIHLPSESLITSSHIGFVGTINIQLPNKQEEETTKFASNISQLCCSFQGFLGMSTLLQQIFIMNESTASINILIQDKEETKLHY
ncbi:hypothetical protein CXB51_032280 [Gossypium anomalum]|uniref:Uncharacterized protein n=1 Tax=Gossypium anomalum TaxID=47600 RepID=A0A8J6CLS4_9ROSI|nr:hypothetical protein CXB51_032280 [Gossypium anomalum]